MPGPEHKTVQLISSRCLTYAQGRSLSQGASSLLRCRVWRWDSHSRIPTCCSSPLPFLLCCPGGEEEREAEYEAAPPQTPRGRLQRYRQSPACANTLHIWVPKRDHHPLTHPRRRLPPCPLWAQPAPSSQALLMVKHFSIMRPFQGHLPRSDDLVVDLQALCVSQPWTAPPAASPRTGKQPAHACPGLGLP